VKPVDFDPAYEVCTKLTSLKDTMDQWFLERTDAIEACIQAIVCKHNVLIVGKHGTSKSDMTNTLFGAFSGWANLFDIQCNKFMTKDNVFGIPNMKLMQEEGIIEHNIDGMLPTADFAFLDELLDANDPVLRSMLDVLNERIFREGRRRVQCPLRTAIATTNFFKDTENLAAVLDRFLVKMTVTPLEDTTSIVGMMENYVSRRKKAFTIPTISEEELNTLHRLRTKVMFPVDVLEVYEKLIQEYIRNCDGKLYVSDRRKCWSIETIRSEAMMQSRSKVDYTDLAAARFALVHIGDTKQEDAFEKAYNKQIGSMEKTQELRKQLNTVKEVLENVSAGMSAKSTTEEQLIDLSRQAKTVIRTVDQRDRSTDLEFADLGREFDEQLEKAKTLVNAAVSQLGQGA